MEAETRVTLPQAKQGMPGTTKLEVTRKVSPRAFRETVVLLTLILDL